MVQIIVQSNVLVRYDVNLDDLVISLKSLIREMEGIEVDKQYLKYGTEELQDNRTLASYDISQDSIVKNQATVYVKNLVGKTLHFSISLHSSVLDLKRLVSERERTPFYEQRFIYAGKQLKDEDSLSLSNIHHESCIHLLLRLRGGGRVRKATGKFLGRAYALVQYDWDGQMSQGLDSGLPVKRGEIVIITGKVHEHLYRARCPDSRIVRLIPCNYVKIILYLDNSFRRFDPDSVWSKLLPRRHFDESAGLSNSRKVQTCSHALSFRRLHYLYSFPTRHNCLSHLKWATLVTAWRKLVSNSNQSVA
ncbi:hypothetical protein GALMADRAFT_746996 [Galerina marginata CBS 339.88]|uniref:Ubiquitin-like domain-containing protein n=1 Tax=Galerina marginata (strain CBS 339.88) TaxID=685588 RepID=A0A067SQ42_GALM3|nr:hypothetical protein GALMADRAFT_746996 [Galerina marginata CBS 339.88]